MGSTVIPLNMYHQYSDERLASVSGSARSSLFREMGFGFASWHASDGVNFSFADGSTRYLISDIDADVLRSLGDREDGNTVPPQ